MKQILKLILSLCLLNILAFSSIANEGTKWKKNMLLIYVPEHQYATMMNDAFADWQGRLKQKMQFYSTKYVKSSNVKENESLVDISVQFGSVVSDDAENKGTTNLVLGRTGAIRKANIFIEIKEDPTLVQDPVKFAENEEEIYRIMLQQVGRSLGLTSSQNPNSVMNDEIQKGQIILPEDVEKLYNLYNWPAYRPLKSR